MTKSKGNKTGKYKVGFCHPPKDHQFKKGQSGNPSGKRSAKLSLYENLVAELQSEKVVILEGKKKKFTAQAIIMKNAISQASSGNPKLLKLLIENAHKIEQLIKQNTKAPPENPRDNHVLKMFMEQAKKYNANLRKS